MNSSFPQANKAHSSQIDVCKCVNRINWAFQASLKPGGSVEPTQVFKVKFLKNYKRDKRRCFLRLSCILSPLRRENNFFEV